MKRIRRYICVMATFFLVSCFVTSIVRADVALNPKIPESKTVIIMFDDGWDDQFAVAVPILQSLGVKASFDVYPAAMDGGWDGFMTWNQLEWLAQNGYDVESHTYSHQDLNRMSQEVLNEELVDSKEAFLKHRIQTGELALPYGNGAENATVIQAAKDAGYLIIRSDDAVLDLTNSTPIAIQVNDMNNATSVQFLSYLLRDAQISILIYHHIDSNPSDKDSVTPSNFTAQMTYLKSSGYNIVTISDLFFDITPLPTPSPTVSPSPTTTVTPTTSMSPTDSPTSTANVPNNNAPTDSRFSVIGLAFLISVFAVCVIITVVLRRKYRGVKK